VSHGSVQQLQAWTGAGAVDVLAHDSDPLAVFGVFAPALLLIALVVGAVVHDRRRPDREDEEADADADAGTSPPRAG
jgi:hypothetical protein